MYFGSSLNLTTIDGNGTFFNRNTSHVEIAGYEPSPSFDPSQDIPIPSHLPIFDCQCAFDSTDPTNPITNTCLGQNSTRALILAPTGIHSISNLQIQNCGALPNPNLNGDIVDPSPNNNDLLEEVGLR
jgi:hypothetical protein